MTSADDDHGRRVARGVRLSARHRLRVDAPSGGGPLDARGGALVTAGGDAHDRMS